MFYAYNFVKRRIVLLIIFIAFLVRFVGLTPNIAHTDEAYTIQHARLLFYNIILHFDFDPHAYKYGSLIFYLQGLPYIPLLVIGFFLVNIGFSNPPPTEFNNSMINFIEYSRDMFSPFILGLGRALTASLGVASVYVTYKIAEKLFGHWVGVAAAFVLAINPFHVRDSHYITTDVPFVFMMLVALWSMVKMVHSKNSKWYFISGFLIGLSATVRYFPLAFLTYPFAVLMDYPKDKSWVGRVIGGILAIPVGIFVGMPFVFINPESRITFQDDIAMQLQWYGTSVTAFVDSVVRFVFSFGKTEVLSLSVLAPTKFIAFHSSFLVFTILGIPLTIFSLCGMLYVFVVYRLKAVFVTIIPLVTFVYISFYVPAVFERLSLPIMPFVGIFTGIGFVAVFNWLKNRLGNNLKASGITALVVIIVLYYPTTTSFASSISCSNESADVQSMPVVEQRIPSDASIAQVSPIILPDKLKSYSREVESNSDFFLSELQGAGFEYVFVNTSIFVRQTYQFENTFFVIPQALYQNYFIPLALREFRTRAQLIHSASRHPMCDGSEFYYYQIPKPFQPSLKYIKGYSFDTSNDVGLWEIEDMGPKSKVTIVHNPLVGYDKLGSLEYSWSNLYYRGPRIMTTRIPVTPGKTYTLTAWVRHVGYLEKNKKDGYFRIDFYDDEFSDIRFPGDSVLSSPRIFGEDKWNLLKASGRAPNNAVFAIVSFTVNGSENTGTFFIDDVNIYESQID